MLKGSKTIKMMKGSKNKTGLMQISMVKAIKVFLHINKHKILAYYDNKKIHDTKYCFWLCSIIKLFLIFPNIHSKTPAAEDLQLYQKDTPTQMISCDYCESFKNTFFTEHLRAAVSGSWSWKHFPVMTHLFFVKLITKQFFED